MGLPLRAGVEKNSRWSGGATLSKEGHADSLLEYERTHHNWFPWKKVQL